jgi:hypothetical protein
MYSSRSWCREGGEPKARYIQENAKTLGGSPFYPTIVELLERDINRLVIEARETLELVELWDKG